MIITLHENFRAVFYAPFYAAFALDAFAAQGIDVRLETSDAPGPTARGLSDDAPSVWWGGPMRILVDRDRDPDSALVSFCEVVTRDPFFLVGNTPNPGFTFSDLTGLRLATVSEVPTPWMCLQQDVRDAGLDPAALDRIADRTMAANADSLRAGTVDVIQVFEPFVEQLVSEGAGYIWYAAAHRGPTSYTAFYTTGQILTGQRDTMLAMMRAIHRTQTWLHGSDPETIANTLKSYFPDIDAATLTGCIARYKSLGLWGRDPFLPEAGFERLKRSCLSGGLIRRGASYRDCVDNSLALAAIGHADKSPPHPNPLPPNGAERE
ncbi:MAG: ABC transporter substrate-binding protein [Proteobacteria bacterium]|nr:ABC transporter substrate-binding protein [Pseudomonadota bacterium]